MCLFTTVDFQLSKNKYKKKKEKSSSGRRRGRRKQHDKGKQQSEPEDPVDPRKSFIVKGRRYLPTGKKRLIDVTAVSKCVLWNLMQVSLYRVGISIYTDKKRLQLPFLSELLVKYVIYYFWFSPGKKCGMKVLFSKWVLNEYEFQPRKLRNLLTHLQVGSLADMYKPMRWDFSFSLTGNWIPLSPFSACASKKSYMASLET